MLTDLVAGCNDLTYNITTGLPDVAGAKYVLNVGFQPGAFVFLDQTEGNMYAIPAPSKHVLSLYDSLIILQHVLDVCIDLAFWTH